MRVAIVLTLLCGCSGPTIPARKPKTPVSAPDNSNLVEFTPPQPAAGFDRHDGQAAFRWLMKQQTAVVDARNSGNVFMEDEAKKRQQEAYQAIAGVSVSWPVYVAFVGRDFLSVDVFDPRRSRVMPTDQFLISGPAGKGESFPLEEWMKTLKTGDRVLLIGTIDSLDAKVSPHHTDWRDYVLKLKTARVEPVKDAPHGAAPAGLP